VSLQFRMKCHSTHKVKEGENLVFDAMCLAASAAEQPAGAFVGAARGKLQLQRLAAQPFQVDDEIIVTIEVVPKPPAEAEAEADPSAPPPKQENASQAQAAAEKPVAAAK
jgi:hypothetical protein